MIAFREQSETDHWFLSLEHTACQWGTVVSRNSYTKPVFIAFCHLQHFFRVRQIWITLNANQSFRRNGFHQLTGCLTGKYKFFSGSLIYIFIFFLLRYEAWQFLPNDIIKIILHPVSKIQYLYKEQNQISKDDTSPVLSFLSFLSRGC